MPDFYETLTDDEVRTRIRKMIDSSDESPLSAECLRDGPSDTAAFFFIAGAIAGTVMRERGERLDGDRGLRLTHDEFKVRGWRVPEPLPTMKSIYEKR